VTLVPNRFENERFVRMRKVLSMTLAAIGLTAALAAAQVATTAQQPAAPPSFSQLGIVVYPAQGQSPQQQAKDEAACWDFAEAQTGIQLNMGQQVNPNAAASQAGDQTAAATQGAAVRGAAKGAIVGTAIGAIAGDTGKGAAIGAVAGAAGGRRARKQAIRSAEQQGAEQAVASNQAMVDQFAKAGVVCLQGRGYTAG
jgi:hypothetical protein